MTRALPDQDARQNIRANHGTNLVCLAGAGAGKTHELVERMVGAVASGDAPVGNMAAITFTRKAAGEMRGRFFTRLNQAVDEVSGRASAHLHVGADQIAQ